MKTILVLSSHPDFAEAIRSSLNVEQYRVIHRQSIDEGEPLLVHGLVSACVLDADLMGVECVWSIERLRRRDSHTPIIAYTELPQSDWEEEAFLRGVTHILTKPVRPRLFNSILERLWAQSAAAHTPVPVVPAGNTAVFARTATDPTAAARFVNAAQTLTVLRDFSSIMTHSLDAEAMLKKFLQFLREILSVNRAAIFLNRPCTPMAELASPDDSRRLRAAAAIGISSSLLQHFELSLDSGIGAQVNRLGRILRRDSDEARMDAEAQKEFDLLGAQVAVPIPDRESIVGLAVFDGRVTGEPLVNVELEMIFHLLEQVGLALRNIWLHDQLAGNNEMMTDVLRELSSACIVFGRDLKVLHANKAARRHFGRKNERTGGLEFSDLPQVLGAKVYQVLKTGAALEPFRYEPENAPGTIYNVSVVPFQRGKVAMPTSVLLTADDLSQSEQLRKLEVETANLRLVRTMADRLAHEIGNAMVPLSTHQQLLAEKFRDAEFRDSLDHALAGGVKRVSRLLNQMRFLARDGQIQTEVFPVGKLIEDAYQDAAQQQSAEGAQLKFENHGKPLVVCGDRPALKHALAEILLNALQANPKSPQIGVTLNPGGANSSHEVTIEVQDNGSGFSAEAARKIPSPFYTTRNVGLGLGLAVSQKIIETHHGKLEIIPSPSGLVRVSLPVESAMEASP
ncbi:MAG: ATP-binding protein [Verrucomicrobiota bacterium]|jgi:signal transduction histidine kinase/DNA-binding response OmpR family regulator